MNLGLGILDILGVLIGFISIMLLLSLIVTALVQATQAIFRARARNLKKGITALLDIIIGEDKENKKRAALILNAENLTVMNRLKKPNSLISKLKGPTVTYIDPAELPVAVDNAGLNLNEEKLKQIKSKYNDFWKRLDSQLNKKFLLIIRVITIFWAVLVASYFQISAPNLFNKLSVNPELRAMYVAQAEQLGDTIDTSIEKSKEYQDVSEIALLRLEKRYPELKESIEEVAGIAKNKESLLEELILVLEDKNQNVPGVIKAYEDILDELYEEKFEKNLEQIREVTDMLGKFNITGWQYGSNFYLKNGSLQWENIFGILITAIFLTFGAPFWFDRLQEVIKLKDILSEGIKPNKKGKKEEGQYLIPY